MEARVPRSEVDWEALVAMRRRQVGQFLSWAAQREAVNSMRLANRPDVVRCGRIAHAFGPPWWAAVVYSCFDSEVGALAVAEAFHDPVSGDEATHRLSSIQLPLGAVGAHRTQPAHKGAKVALAAACAQARQFEAILKKGRGFHDRYLALRRLNASQWGRTTCYDLLVRAGQLRIGGLPVYEPDRAYLADSTGPRKGFELLWGIAVTRSNADECEALLRGWKARWQQIAAQVGVGWTGEPYGPGDFENALCIFQERGSPGHAMASP